MRKLITAVIDAYQTVSAHIWMTLGLPFPYSSCRFHPSCSEFSKHAVTLHGSLKGGAMAAVRILRCNAFFQGRSRRSEI